MRIALLGYGVEGESAYKYYSRTQPDAEFVIYDNAATPKYEVPSGVKFVGNVTDFHDIDADIVVKTPAIAPSKVSSSGRVTSVTREFFAKSPAPIIGVTGTKGKGTTCTLIYEILKAAGKTVWLVGNIGTPALDVLDKVQQDDIVVYELSSFQLWDIDTSPHIAVVLMVERDHMNVHSDMNDYIDAKKGIAKYQSQQDVMIFHPTNEDSRKIADVSDGKKQRYLTTGGAFVDDEFVVIDGQRICAVSEVGLLGEHNLENICAALTAAWYYTQDTKAISSAIKNFKGLPHHVEKVRTLDGVTFYDDSFSSAPAAAVAAIKSFSEPQVVILGGVDRDADFAELANTIKASENIKKVLLIGESAQKIAAALNSVGETRYELLGAQDFAEIVRRAYELAQPSGVVVLSPGCPSFDMFKDFYQRGDKFQELVRSL